MAIILFTEGSILSGELIKGFRISKSDLLSTSYCTQTDNGDIRVEKCLVVDSSDNRDLPFWLYEKSLKEFSKEYPNGTIIKSKPRKV